MSRPEACRFCGRAAGWSSYGKRGRIPLCGDEHCSWRATCLHNGDDPKDPPLLIVDFAPRQGQSRIRYLEFK